MEEPNEKCVPSKVRWSWAFAFDPRKLCHSSSETLSYLALELVLFDCGDPEDAFNELEVTFDGTTLALVLIGIFDADDVVEDVPTILVEIEVADDTMGVIWFGAGDAVL